MQIKWIGLSHSFDENYETMKQILFAGITPDELVELFVVASADRALEDMKKLLNEHIPNREGNKQITRKEVAVLLNVSPPTVDKYTAEGLLVKIGVGKRARYQLDAVEAARAEINKSLYKQRDTQLYSRRRTNKQK